MKSFESDSGVAPWSLPQHSHGQIPPLLLRSAIKTVKILDPELVLIIIGNCENLM